MFLNFYRMDLIQVTLEGLDYPQTDVTRSQINRAGTLLDALFKEILPKLHSHFVELGVRLEVFLMDWCDHKTSLIISTN